MVVKCITISGADLPESYKKKGYKRTTFNNLTVNEEYFVYGISSFDFMLGYLIKEDNTGFPFWKPAPLFNVCEKSLPHTWLFNYFSNNEHHVDFIAGYSELVNNKAHFDGLNDLSTKHLKVFEKEAAKMY